jgi:hypothetical protein
VIEKKESFFEMSNLITAMYYATKVSIHTRRTKGYLENNPAVCWPVIVAIGFENKYRMSRATTRKAKHPTTFYFLLISDFLNTEKLCF